MKVVILTGSPHKHGTSAALADAFENGVRENGNEVYRFDSAFKKVAPCMACDHCRRTGEPCVIEDDMRELGPHLLNADVIAFVSPVFYYSMSAQIKTVIDRFYKYDAAIQNNKRSVLMMTMADTTDEAAEGAICSYHGMIGYLGWKDAGKVICADCADLPALHAGDYEKRAYELGKSL